MGKITEKKKWAIFFEILRRKSVFYTLILIVLALGFVMQYYDVKLIAYKVLKFMFTH